jgi:hypothetical protein
MTLRTIACTLALLVTTAASAALKAGDPAPAFSAPASLAGKPFSYSLKDGLRRGRWSCTSIRRPIRGMQHPGA